MAQDGKDNKSGMSCLQKAKLLGIATLLAWSGSNYHTPERKKYELEDYVNVPDLGKVPRDLYDKGIASLEKGLASTILSIYCLSRYYNENRRVSEQGVTTDIINRVECDNEIVAVLSDKGMRIYNKENIWRTPDEGRALFVKKIKEALSKISNTQYKGLNDKLKEVVDHAKDIVAEDSLELKVVHYRPDTLPRGPY